MALTGGNWYLSVQLTDSSGVNTFGKRYQLVATDATTAAASAAAVIAALNNMTDCPIVSYHYYQEFVEDALTLPSGVEGENKALLTFRIDGAPNKSASDTIPGASEGIFVAATGSGRNVVDTTDAAVTAYRDLFVSGGSAYISDGENVSELKGGKRIHSKSNRG